MEKLIVSVVFLFSVVSHSKAVLQSNEWNGDNAKRLQKMMDEKGKGSKGYSSKKKPVAVFDWDNTVIKNDVGDATMFWMVSNGKVKKPKSWRETSLYLTDEAVQALEKSCGALKDPLPTNTNAECADQILTIYSDGKLANGNSAWDGKHNPDTMEPAYAWTVQLYAGYSPSEVTSFAKEAIAFNLKNELGAKQKIGTKEYVAYLRIYEPIKELIEALKLNGFDVWVSTASLEYIVKAFAEKVGVAKDHVIGVRPVVDSKNHITYAFQKCSNAKDDGSYINYRLGKRCWINKVIFKETDTAKLEQPSPIEFAAGDSDTDAFFVKDARSLRLAINRNKTELMCNAFANQDGKWIVNPMFIEPKSQKTSGYSCGKFGLSDQKDSVF